MKSTSLSLLLLCGTAFVLHAQEAEAPPVRTTTPTPAAEASRYDVPGRTEPIESATIFTRATGIVRERYFEIGEVVKQNDILAIIDAPEIDRQVEAAKANVEAAKARAANALNLSNRSSRLLKSDVVSTEETEQRQSVAVETSAAVRVAQAELARLEEQQRFSTVRAPFDGVISARNLDRGDLVRGDASSGDGWIYQLNRLNTLRFVVNATPDLALRLAGDAKATVRFSEFPGREFPAKVAHASRLFENATGTMRVELLVENEDLSLPAGLTGTAQFSLPPMAGTFLVPTNALTLKEGKNMVATVNDGKVHFLEVLPGRNFGRNVEVVSSKISADTAVILNPNAMLREGDAVSAAPLTAAK
jgi:membrane fusion protein, multidrug efflux system